jgi:hypothetical protein
MALRDASDQGPTQGKESDEPIVVRPSWRAYGTDVRKRAPFAIGLVPLILASIASATAFNRGHAPGLLAALLGGILGIALVVGVAFTVNYMLGRKIVATAGEVRVLRLFRQPAVVPITSIHRVVRCTLSYSSNLTEPAVFAMDATGRCVLSLYAGPWSWSDLEAVWLRVGIRPEGSWGDLVPYEEIGDRFGVQS